MKLHQRLSFSIIGAVIGLGAPLGCVFIRALLGHHFNWNWMLLEISHFPVHYSYMALTTPIIFAGFGLAMGIYSEKFEAQRSGLEKINTSLQEQSISDELTGFYNRRHILYEIQKEVERARRYHHTLVGIMLDVDDFKKFNDKYGHLVGDYVLKEVANIFDHCIRSIDILGRYGGDEFIVVLPEAGLETGLLVAERIRKAIALHEFKANKKIFKVTVSLGIHYFEDLAQIDKFTFIEKIDKALFEAKKTGKNRTASSGPCNAETSAKKHSRGTFKRKE